jgi:hypothetical protein
MLISAVVLAGLKEEAIEDRGDEGTDENLEQEKLTHVFRARLTP